MKKLTISALCLLALTLMGCRELTPEQRQQRLDDMYGGALKTVNYRGHSYIIFIFDGVKQGGITHDPECPCLEKGAEE